MVDTMIETVNERNRIDKREFARWWSARFGRHRPRTDDPVGEQEARGRKRGQMATRKAIQSGIGKIEANRCGCASVPLPVYGKRKRNRELDGGSGGSGDGGSRRLVAMPRFATTHGYCHG